MIGETIILVLLLLLSVQGVLLWYAAFKDFVSRKFSNAASRNKWRWIISFVPFGYLLYLKKYYNKPADIDR